MLDAKLFIGRSAEIVQRYVGPGGVVEGKLEKYKDYLASAATSKLVV
jgi:adenylosuccinate lyase